MTERRLGSINWIMNMTASVWLRGSNWTSSWSVRPLMLALTPLKVTASLAHRLQLTVVRGADEEASAGVSEPPLETCAGAVTGGAEHWASSFRSWAEPPFGARPASSNTMVPATRRCRRTRTINNVPDSHEYACILCWPNAAFNPRPGLLVTRPAQGANMDKQREFWAGAASLPPRGAGSPPG